MVFIVGVALFWRLWQLGSIPISLYWDEAAMLVDVKSVVQSGQDMHGRPWYQVLYPSYGDYKQPVYIWLATGVAKIWGVSEWSLRLPSALAGVVTVVVAGLIAREIAFQSERDRKKKPSAHTQWWAEALQLSTMGVIALAPWSILFSRTAFEGHVGQAFLALSVWFLLKATRQWWWVLLAAGCGVLATYSYFSVRFVWPVVMLGWLSWVWWQQNRTQLKTSSFFTFLVPRILVAIVVFAIGLIPMVRSPLYKDSNAFRLGTDSVLKNEEQVLTSNVYRELAGNTPLDRVIFHRWWLTLKELLINYSDHVSFSFLFITGDENLRHGTTEHGLFLFSFAVMFGIGFIHLGSRRRSLLLVLVLWWLIALLPASVPENTPHALRSLNALVPLALIMGWGLAVFIQGVWQAWEKTVQKATLPPLVRAWSLTVLLVVYAVWVTSDVITFGFHYFKVYAIESASEWQEGYKELAETIERVRAEDHTSVIILPFDDRFYLWSMAYGPYTAVDFHSWSSDHWQFKGFGGIDFSGHGDWQSTLRSEGKVVIAGRSEEVDSWLEETQITPAYQEDIPNARGQDLYTVVVVRQ